MWRGPLTYGQAVQDRTLLMPAILGSGRQRFTPARAGPDQVTRRGGLDRPPPGERGDPLIGPGAVGRRLLGGEGRAAVVLGQVGPHERQPALGDLGVEPVDREADGGGEVPG